MALPVERVSDGHDGSVHLLDKRRKIGQAEDAKKMRRDRKHRIDP